MGRSYKINHLYERPVAAISPCRDSLTAGSHRVDLSLKVVEGLRERDGRAVGWVDLIHPVGGDRLTTLGFVSPRSNPGRPGDRDMKSASTAPTLGSQIARHWQIGLFAENLLDKKYDEGLQTGTLGALLGHRGHGPLLQNQNLVGAAHGRDESAQSPVCTPR